ncbi:hypothetical protein PybrP1_000812 [[Pythium] brassicae (nom. inval.)]|nr:hypothetical protein PybrP1_000812 [[Pythium] brassicae (nom. inval.)]
MQSFHAAGHDHELGASRRPLAPLVTLAGRRGFSTGSSSKSKSSSDSFFKRAWTKYLVLLETRPLATKIVTGGAIAGIGDINCQLFLEHGKPFDAKRTAVFTFLGGVFISPILHVWYGFLGRVVPGTTSLAAAKRVALDVLVSGSVLGSLLFMAEAVVGSTDEALEKFQQEWWPAVKANWFVWGPVQMFNFRFVPGNLQVLFSNIDAVTPLRVSS